MVRLATTEYAGTNHTHLTELLREREGINLSLSQKSELLPIIGANGD